MSESQANFGQGPSEQGIRDEYLQAVDFTPGAELRAVTAFTFTAELRDITNEMRAHALMPVTHGLEFIEEIMREPDTSATQDLPPSENR